MRTRAPRSLFVFVIVTALATVLVGCSGGEPQVEAGDLPSFAEEPPASPTTSPLASDAVNPPAAAGGDEGEQAPPARPGPGRGQRQPFPADTKPDVSSVHQGFPVLVAVTKGLHPGYVRYVFEFTNNDPEGHSPLVARPAWDVRYVPKSEAVMDGSGEPVPVGGRERLRMRFDGAAMHWEDGRSSLSRSVPDHDPLVFGGDFEGTVAWFLGLDKQQPFRVFFTDNNKVVVDVVSGG